MGADLWHYTDAVGFYNIFRTGCLRLGDSRFLNDRTERTYGLHLVRQVLDGYLASADSSPFLAAARSYMDPGQTDTTLYLCAFSSRNDSIGQWQRYGANGTGYCLGFERRRLTEQILDRVGVELHKMVYGQHEQEALVRQKLSELLAKAETLKEVSPEESEQQFTDLAGMAIAISLEEVALRLKHPLFEDEAESRLIKEVLLGSETVDPVVVNFSCRGDYVKPYIEIAIHGDESETIPVAEVVCGPKLDGDLAINSSQHFLETVGYEDCLVSWSELHEIWR
jgi:hypothetical protein